MADTHWIAASAALIAAAMVFASRKGTRFHRRLGWTYVLAMLLVNATARGAAAPAGGPAPGRQRR